MGAGAFGYNGDSSNKRCARGFMVGGCLTGTVVQGDFGAATRRVLLQNAKALDNRGLTELHRAGRQAFSIEAEPQLTLRAFYGTVSFPKRSASSSP